VVILFSGLIQDVGSLKGMGLMGTGGFMSIETSLAPEISEGDSVAVNGVCLTATKVGPYFFDVDIMKQTLAITALGDRHPQAGLNLELAMQVGDRLGGHILQGHIDGIGKVIAVKEDGFARRLRVELPPPLMRYVIDKGSIALDGVSLTIARLGDHRIEVSLIPETLERTNLGEAQEGAKLNVECDVIAKYVERLVAPFAGKEQA
jgi:riboflavin synthase